MITNEKPSPQYLHPYACFQCRKSFRRASRPDAVLICPHCGGPSIGLNRKFKAPKASDLKQWDKVERLVRHGFFFESVGEPYPTELRDVDAFAEKHSAYLTRRRQKHASTYEAIEAALNGRVDR
jgi:hypothetical protein